MNASEYKKYHESFMTNNHGTNAVHTFLCILFPVQCLLLCYLIPKRPTKWQYITEYLTVVVPLIFILTTFAGYVYQINFVLSFTIIVLAIKHCKKINCRSVLYEQNVHRTSKIVSISLFRGLTYLLTVFCILAVDFRIFPRFLAKTEFYGFSLMDAGVGMFVLISGVVHKDVNSNFSSLIRNNAKLIGILLILGVSRFVAVKQLNYQEHVSEYGVHWNFFYTLAVTKTLSAILLHFISKKHILKVSILIACIHEYALGYVLQSWVLGDVPRKTFLDANREGISASLGYVSLYLFGVYLKSKLQDQKVLKFDVIIRLFSMSVAIWFITYMLNIYKPISRSLCNITYCFYVEAVIITIILILYSFEIVFQDKQLSIPITIEVINNNGLLYFLFGNILTGLINLTVRTLFIKSYLSLLIFNVYMIVTIYFASFLHRRGIKI